ncbi:MAG: type II toxin-antitoxin system HicB family antitoxin [Proteobacteria bacterium]|nr:type II toxin-antitoxin system HicB family antitoxin [Pseudomonadota bacterium]
MLAYPITLIPDGDTVMATCKDFPEVSTFGEDNDDALLHAADALEEAIDARIAGRQEIPQPSRGKVRVPLPTQTAITVLVYQTMMKKGLKKAGLARLLAWHGPQVDRLLDVHHATRLDHVDAAMAAMEKRIEVKAAG